MPDATPRRPARPTGYQRRRPEQTVLYRVVHTHLDAFLAHARETHGKPLPRYVERELRAYLKCGILAHGFLRAECTTCGHELLVAFSCKRRGLCPSCNARRMANTAAHLVDRVYPDVPVRQWVLSTPFELRILLARNVKAFNRLIKTFAEEVMRSQRTRAKALGIQTPTSAGVSFPQRFGSALNLNTHVHAVWCDGVFAIDGATASFHPLPAPTRGDLTGVCQRVHRRFYRWLVKEDLVTEQPDLFDNTTPELDALDACTRGALGMGQLERVKGGDDDPDEPEAPKQRRRARGKHVGEADGFNIHAGITAPAGNVYGRELLLRYCARPPIALGRLSELPDGRLAYKLKNPWHADKTHIVLSPIELLARITALVPPPRSPLIHFHGGFAPSSRKRKLIVTSGRASPAPAPARPEHNHHTKAKPKPAPPKDEQPARPPTSARPPTDAPPSVHALIETAAPQQPSSAERAIYRIDWAELLKRVYDVDVLACPCGGRLKFVELLTEQQAAREILIRLGLDPDPPTFAKADLHPLDLDQTPPDWDP